MKVLVTGAPGFLGSHLISRLILQGHEIRALVRTTSRIDHLLHPNVQIVYGDLKHKNTLEHAVDGVDIIYHAGAATRGTWNEYEESTVKGTNCMLQLALSAGVTRFIHISSVVIYNVYDLDRNTLISENYSYETNPREVGPYTYSKVASEKAVFTYYEKGLPVVVLRPGLIYGPGRKGLFPLIGYFLTDKVFLIVGKGDNYLPLTYVDNAVDAILLAATRQRCLGKAYNLVDDVLMTQKEYLNKYRKGTDSKFITLSVPFSLLICFTILIDKFRSIGIIKNPSPTKYGLISKWKSLQFDISMARRELNWEPKITLEEGLERTFEWYKQVHSCRK